MKYIAIGITFLGIGIGAGISAFAGMEPDFGIIGFTALISFCGVKFISALQGVD